MTTDLDKFTTDVLIKLQEECGEVIQIVSKTLLFGPDGWHPDDPAKKNHQLLEEEVGDVLAMIDLLVEAGIGITDKGLLKAKKEKFRKLIRWHDGIQCRTKTPKS